MLNLQLSKQFKKDYKRVVKQGKDIDELWLVIENLRKGERLASKYEDHQLTGNYKHHRECHIYPDWLLIYKVGRDNLVLTAVRTGSHSDLY